MSSAFTTHTWATETEGSPTAGSLPFEPPNEQQVKLPSGESLPYSVLCLERPATKAPAEKVLDKSKHVRKT